MKNWTPVDDVRIMNIMSYCVDAYGERDFVAARQYAMDVLEINANNPFALVYFELSDAWSKELDERRFSRVAANVFEAIETLIDECDGSESSCQLCDIALRHLGELAMAHMDDFASRRSSNYDQFYNSKISSVVDDLNNTYYKCIMYIKDPAKVEGDMYEYLKGVAEASISMTTSDFPAKVIEACNNRLYIRDNGTKAPLVSDYWENRSEEMSSTTAEAEAVLQKLDELTAEIDSLNERKNAEIQKVNVAINELRAQRARLGLFKKREKESIDNRIADKQFEITRIEERYVKRLNSIQEEKREYEEKAEYFVNIMLNGK